ncbi:hypothetical protein DFH27DRAFT_521455 [Peziza echinospora]|nr:hypothetical protein DFH27DRAFT_521455 [Peziza echinospora]
MTMDAAFDENTAFVSEMTPRKRPRIADAVKEAHGPEYKMDSQSLVLTDHSVASVTTSAVGSAKDPWSLFDCESTASNNYLTFKEKAQIIKTRSLGASIVQRAKMEQKLYEQERAKMLEAFENGVVNSLREQYVPTGESDAEISFSGIAVNATSPPKTPEKRTLAISSSSALKSPKKSRVPPNTTSSPAKSTIPVPVRPGSKYVLTPIKLRASSAKKETEAIITPQGPQGREKAVPFVGWGERSPANQGYMSFEKPPGPAAKVTIHRGRGQREPFKPGHHLFAKPPRPARGTDGPVESPKVVVKATSRIPAPKTPHSQRSPLKDLKRKHGGE